MKYWQEYVRSSYDLVLEAEGKAAVYLNDDIESYLVRLLARWFDRADIPPETPVAILLMTAMQKPKEQELAKVADICLFYDSFKIKHQRWPSNSYYRDMGQIAYGMAYTASNDRLYNQLETKFSSCSKILSNIKVQL